VTSVYLELKLELYVAGHGDGVWGGLDLDLALELEVNEQGMSSELPGFHSY